MDDTLKITGITQIDELGEQNDHPRNQCAIAVGDFDGDGIRFGSPTFHQAKDVGQPVVILNAPPIHFDVFSDTFDVNMCFGENHGSNRFIARYMKENSSSSEVLAKVTSDWGLSGGIGFTGSYMESSANAYLEGTYGFGFSHIQAKFFEITVGSTQPAHYYDWILASYVDYDIWEYPVTYDDSTQGHVAVVVPCDRRSKWYSIETWNDDNYMFKHEAGNLLSYQHYDKIDRDDENIDELISGDLLYEINPFSYAAYHPDYPDWYVDLEYMQSEGVSIEHTVGMEMGAALTGDGLNVNVVGSYSRSQINTFITTFTDEIILEIFFENTTTEVEAPYNITPYAYWSTNGALVLDYDVELLTWEDTGAQTFWDKYYNIPDLSLVLPWRYHLEKGIHLTDKSKKYKSHDIFIQPDSLEPGMGVTLYANIHNFSLKNCTTDVEVQFYHGNPEISGTAIGSTTIVGGLPSREVEQVFIDWTIPEDVPDTSRIYVLIDSENVISEIHDNNNKGWMLLRVPDGIPADIEDSGINNQFPNQYKLHSNYPNPFNPYTTIKYDIPQNEHVELVIFNLLGQKIKTLISKEQQAGHYKTAWDGTTDLGRIVSSGIYIFRMRAGDFIDHKRMIMLK